MESTISFDSLIRMDLCGWQKPQNTLTNDDNAQQNFINCVSAFSHQRKLVLGVKMMENKQESEISVVRDLIELLDLTGVVFTFDPLDCQTKLSPQSLTLAMTI